MNQFRVRMGLSILGKVRRVCIAIGQPQKLEDRTEELKGRRWEHFILRVQGLPFASDGDYGKHDA